MQPRSLLHKGWSGLEEDSMSSRRLSALGCKQIGSPVRNTSPGTSRQPSLRARQKQLQLCQFVWFICAHIVPKLAFEQSLRHERCWEHRWLLGPTAPESNRSWTSRQSFLFLHVEIQSIKVFFSHYLELVFSVYVLLVTIGPEHSLLVIVDGDWEQRDWIEGQEIISEIDSFWLVKGGLAGPVVVTLVLSRGVRGWKIPFSIWADFCFTCWKVYSKRLAVISY